MDAQCLVEDSSSRRILKEEERGSEKRNFHRFFLSLHL
jgi:hypothetical protein